MWSSQYRQRYGSLSVSSRSGSGVSSRSGLNRCGIFRHLDGDDGFFRILDIEYDAFRQHDVLGEDLGTIGQAINVDHDLLRQVGDIGADLELLDVDECDSSAFGVPSTNTGTSTSIFSPALTS